jgi:hypothetical protein
MAKDYEGFGKAVMTWVTEGVEEFFSYENSENIMQLAQQHGVVERVAYDPEVHTDVDGEYYSKGDMIWYWGDLGLGGSDGKTRSCNH